MEEETFERYPAHELVYLDFYSLVKYCNENWKSGFTEKEIALNAYIYFDEYKKSLKNRKCTDMIYDLVKKLKADNTEESNCWRNDILLLILGDADFSEKDKEYEVEIVETYKRRVKVRAADEDEAFSIIDEYVHDGTIDLPRDGKDYEFDVELHVSEAKEDVTTTGCPQSFGNYYSR